MAAMFAVKIHVPNEKPWGGDGRGRQCSLQAVDEAVTYF